MDTIQLATWINELIEKDELWRFYKSNLWKRKKESVLIKYHYQCQNCAINGVLKTHEEDKCGNMVWISTVHHINHVRNNPELALSEYYYDSDKTIKRNLIPVCKACHNKLHPEKHKVKDGSGRKERLITEERW